MIISKLRIEKISISWTLVLLLIMVSLSFSQTNKKKVERQENPSETILAKVGNKTISLNEFIRRAEYTIRPNYCKGDNMIDKKIILNSLIAEKMLALEAGTNNDMANNKSFQNFIRGHQEQVMREWLFHKEGFEKVHLNESEIQKTYHLAGRTYNLKYVIINDDSLAKAINRTAYDKEQLFDTTQKRSLSEINNILQRNVSFKSDELPIIEEALFTNDVLPNQIIGPLQTDKQQYIVMKVLGWTDSVVVSEKEQGLRWNDVKENLRLMRARKIYENFITKLMVGKKMELIHNTFYEVADLLSPYYIRTPENMKNYYSGTFHDKIEIPKIKELISGTEKLLDKPFLYIDGKEWTVNDFGSELQGHPLVFRKKVKEKKDYYKQFKLAIVDLIRDKYLTKVAYARGYQNLNLVKRDTQMWKDAYLAIYQRSKYLEGKLPKSTDSLNIVTVIDKFMNPYIKKLQLKYNDQIEVNVQEFNAIKLSRIDMYVTLQNVPYVSVVPFFPDLTTISKLDYGKRLQ